MPRRIGERLLSLFPLLESVAGYPAVLCSNILQVLICASSHLAAGHPMSFSELDSSPIPLTFLATPFGKRLRYLVSAPHWPQSCRLPHPPPCYVELAATSEFCLPAPVGVTKL